MNMLRTFCRTCLLFAIMAAMPWAVAQDKGKYAVKSQEAAPPNELSEPIRKLLSNESLAFLDSSGQPLLTIWLRKEIPTDATPEQIKNGITYRELKQSELMGAIRFEREWSDYRKQKIKPGVYTLRLAFQPTDGKHTADVSEFQDFLVVLSPKADATPELMEPKQLQETSADSIGSGHPGVFMLVPTKASKAAEVAARPKEHWMVTTKAPLSAGGKATGAFLGIGLNLVGHSPVE
jgi:hypothetical protein